MVSHGVYMVDSNEKCTQHISTRFLEILVSTYGPGPYGLGPNTPGPYHKSWPKCQKRKEEEEKKSCFRPRTQIYGHSVFNILSRTYSSPLDTLHAI